MTLRDALRKLRREAGGITQAEAAKRVGAPRETWNKWESTKRPRALSTYYARVIEDRFRLEDGSLEPFVDSRQAAGPDELAHLASRVDDLEVRLERALEGRPGDAEEGAAPK